MQMSRPNMLGGPVAGEGQMNRPQPTEEDIMALLQQMEQMEQMGESIPPDLAALMQQVKRSQGQPTQEMPTEEITPEPGFVIKTQDLASGSKVFINMVGHASVAAPGNWANGMMPDSVQQALDNADNLTDAQAEALRFPLSMSAPRTEADKKGEPATCYDCCLNGDVVKMCSAHRPLKVFIIELAINWINHKHQAQLDPKYKLPKMRYKGETVEVQRIRVEPKKLVTEIREIPEDPVFPLVTKKLPPGKLPAPVPAPAPSTSGPAADSSAGAGTSGRNGSTSVNNGFHQLGELQFDGRPVQSTGVRVGLPTALASRLASGQTEVAGEVVVEVCGQQVQVAAPGFSPLHLKLPLAVTSKGASVVFDWSSPASPCLQLHLPYMSVTDVVAAAAAQAPHAPGTLELASASTAMQLEP